MKKNLLTTGIVIMVFLTGISGVNAQIFSDTRTSIYQKGVEMSHITSNSIDSHLERATINPRALKHFSSTYKNITGENWGKTVSGYSAWFKNEGVRTVIYYDIKGRWLGTLKNYTEEKLSFRMRGIIKSVYYDYTITNIEELETGESNHLPTYIICMEDTNTIKYIRMYDENMEVWKEYLKPVY